MKSIPFTLPELNGGLTEITGRMYQEEEFIVFDVEEAFLGEFGKEGQTIKIEPAAIRHIELDEGIFKDKIRIRPKKPDLLDVLPGKYQGEVAFSIWRKYRDDAEEVVEWAKRKMSV